LTERPLHLILFYLCSRNLGHNSQRYDNDATPFGTRKHVYDHELLTNHCHQKGTPTARRIAKKEHNRRATVLQIAYLTWPKEQFGGGLRRLSLQDNSWFLNSHQPQSVLRSYAVLPSHTHRNRRASVQVRCPGR